MKKTIYIRILYYLNEQQQKAKTKKLKKQNRSVVLFIIRATMSHKKTRKKNFHL
jgi:uncharacterized protein YtpQ (UPF0354 family)